MQIIALECAQNKQEPQQNILAPKIDLMPRFIQTLGMLFIGQGLIQLVTNPGDLVLDPFGGSGTTAIVAAHHGRKWIICELNPQYATLAEQRIAEGWTPPKVKKPRRKRHTKQKALFNADAC